MKIEMNPGAKILFGALLLLLSLLAADEIVEHVKSGDLPFVLILTPFTAILALFAVGVICKQIGSFFCKRT